jgi:prepilin-type N-terminal cleavage/methylation domain-containing protein
LRISDIFQKFTRNSSGFTLLEVAVGLSILSMGVGLIGTSVFQVLSIQRHWQADRVATKDLRHTGSWFAGDALNAETVVIGGTPDEPTVTLSWSELVDNSIPGSPVFQSRSSVYSLDGDTLTRNNDGVITTLADDVASAVFSLSGRVLTLNMTVNSGNGGTTPMTLQTYLRVLQS